jgi:hypothetical protein
MGTQTTPLDEQTPGLEATPYPDVEAEVAASLAALDLEAIKEAFWSQDHFVFIPELLNAPLRERLQGELQRFKQEDVRRIYLPFARKGGSIGQARVAAKAPELDAFHRSPSLIEFMREIAGLDLSPKAEEDDHGATLLYYQRKGDYCAHHYDGCGCEPDANFTLTVGLSQRGGPHSEYELFGRDKTQPTQKLCLTLEPGAAVFYRGSQIYHGITPLAESEERIVYSLTYSEVSARPTGLRLLRHKVNDILMFGFGALFRKKGG